MRANTGCEHRVPAPERLFPERLGPGELAVFDHVLVATPDAVDQNVDMAGFAQHRIECGLHLHIISMVAADRGSQVVRTSPFGSRAASNVHARARVSELTCDPAAYAFRTSGDHRNFAVQVHGFPR